MAVIQKLSSQVANQIAAGEVVERPASVVKELVENSLDAGATRIEVHLEDGGRRRIRVVDNGCGIAAEQVLLAFERHATSKLQEAAQLARVGTYGFRGEALASISSVARVEMTSRTRDAELGTAVRGDGRGDFDVKPVACAAGTDLAIEALFESVPARREFLRTAATELGHVIRLIDSLALARLDLHLLLLHNGRKVSEHLPADDLLSRCRSVLGSDVVGQLHAVQGDGDYRVDGALSAPTLTRGTSAGITLLVDGRPVSDSVVVHAIRVAYGSRIPERRYPVGVVRLNCPPATVDVNVHPTKNEVRFLSKRAVHAAVLAAVSDMLDQGAWLQSEGREVPATRKGARPTPPSRSAARQAVGHGDLFFDRPRGATATRPRQPKPSTGRPTSTPPSTARMERWSSLGTDPQAMDESSAGATVDVKPTSPSGDGFITLMQAAPGPLQTPLRARFVAEVFQRWLLFEAGDALVLVEREVAAATVTIAHGGVATERLMIPVHVAIGPPLVAATVAATKRLQRRGLEIAQAPQGGLLVRTAPVGLDRAGVASLLRALAGGLVALGANATSAQMHARIDSVLATQMARARHAQTPEDAAATLAAQLDGLPLPAHCSAGGRVTAVVTQAWLDAQFEAGLG